MNHKEKQPWFFQMKGWETKKKKTKSKSRILKETVSGESNSQEISASRVA